MQAILHNIGKKFGTKWILRNQNFSFESGRHYAITGRNGSGKSTLLLMLAGYITPTSGKIEWNCNNLSIPVEKVHSYIAIASPYLELVEHFSLIETLEFQAKFKPYLHHLGINKLLELSGLKDAGNKPLKYFSSGMKQRVKLLLALASAADLVLLDEPCSNLDNQAIQWYQNLKQDLAKNRSVVVCSNHNTHEYPEVDSILCI